MATTKNTKESTVKKATTSKSVKKELLIKIEDLCTSFPDGKNNTKVVHDKLNIEVKENEILAIIGKNGAGKTVLVETIAGLRKIQSGNMILKKDFDIKNEVGIQFQTEDDASSIIKPKHLIAFYKNLYGDRISDEEFEEMKNIFNVNEFIDRKVKMLSGGQRQRINLLLAIMAKPKLLILDEFTTGLDITSVIDVLDYIKKFSKENNSTIIIVTHNSKEIKLLADRVILIKDGIAKSEFTSKQISEKYKDDFDEFLLDQIREGK